jgi:hypothetical protein
MVMLILGEDIDILTKIVYILTSHSIRNINHVLAMRIFDIDI